MRVGHFVLILYVNRLISRHDYYDLIEFAENKSHYENKSAPILVRWLYENC